MIDYAEKRTEILGMIRKVCKELHGPTVILEDVVYGCERTLRWLDKAERTPNETNREFYMERYNKGKSDLEYYLTQYVKYCSGGKNDNE